MTDNNMQPSGTAMRPQTAAKKLGIYLPAAPQEFQDGAITHAELRDLHTNPPEWLAELRRTGPYPRPIVAQKLGISVTALKKNDMDKPLNAAEVKELLENQPDWLRAARTAHADSRAESAEGAEGDVESAAASGEVDTSKLPENKDFVDAIEESLAEGEAAVGEATPADAEAESESADAPEEDAK
ncbi:MAG TPA: hypothetical protein DHV38_03605 [Corynebacterium casei]|nr:hypothetical protein [Corynebacterium casei]